ncbi:hypothetical protein GCM10008932_14850 [Alkalibacterium iburiense]|uniref:ECF transporter S component, folate family n=1 Tax=Alkalibacterium iburiense TaxID=290589 RepID=A0ABN0XGR2_9LACT
MTQSPTNNRKTWIETLVIGVLVPALISFIIPYWRSQNGLNDGVTDAVAQESWQMILTDFFYLFLFTGVLFVSTLHLIKRILDENVLLTLLLGVLITGTAFVLYIQREILQFSVVYEGNRVLYSIAFLFYSCLLLYRFIQTTRFELDTKEIAVVGLLIAMNIALGRIGISTPVVRVTFAFLPTALIAMLFGPWVGGIAAAFSDLLSFLIAGGSGAFFPGFTVSAFLTGFIYGLIIHKKTLTLKRIILAEVIIAVFIHIGLNTIWIYILTQNPLAVILPPRLIQNAVTIVVRVMSVWFISKNKQLKRVYMKYSTAKS